MDDAAFGPVARRLAASVAGQGAETLLFLNGFGTEQVVWRDQVQRLGTRFRVVTFDYVGTGRSDIAHYSAARYASLHDHVDDALALLDELDVGEFSVVGHSVGSMIGALVSLACRDRCRSLAMIGGSPRYIDAHDYVGGFSEAAVDAVLAEMAANYQAWAVGFSKVIAANPDQPHVANSYAEFLKSLRPDIAHAMLRMIFHSDMRPIVPRIAVPTLIVQASEDIAVPGEVARYLLAHIANAELREVAYAGHLPHMLAPKKVGDILEEFFDRAIIGGHA